MHLSDQSCSRGVMLCFIMCFNCVPQRSGIYIFKEMNLFGTKRLQNKYQRHCCMITVSYMIDLPSSWWGLQFLAEPSWSPLPLPLASSFQASQPTCRSTTSRFWPPAHTCVLFTQSKKVKPHVLCCGSPERRSKTFCLSLSAGFINLLSGMEVSGKPP